MHPNLEPEILAAKAATAIVGDEENILELVESKVIREGFRVIGFETGEPAREPAPSRRPDWIVSDFMLPSIDALVVFSRIKADSQSQQTRLSVIGPSTGRSSVESAIDSWITRDCDAT